MRIPNFALPDFRLDINTLGAVFGILLTIAAAIGAVIGSGALNDQSGSSRGARMEVVDPTTGAPAPVEPSRNDSQVEDYLSPVIREQSNEFERLANQAFESMRRQDELIRQSEEAIRRADELIRQREAAGAY